MNTIPLRQLSAYRAMRDGFLRLNIALDDILMATGRLKTLDDVLPSRELAELFDRAWEAASAQCNDPAIGLKMTPRQPMLGLGSMAHLVLAAPDIKTALLQLSRFTGVISPTTSVALDITDRVCRITLRLAPGRRPAVHHRYDFMGATILHGVQWISGQMLKPLRVCHPMAAPECDEAWRTYFEAPMVFGAPEFALEYSLDILALPMPTADPSIADLSEQLAQRWLAKQGGNLVAQVRQVVSRELSRGDPRREHVAAALHMSERTLQRRLHELGTTFNDVVDDTRRELAQRYLSSGASSPTEMSFALGFSDPSNFYRACKRWFGRSPGELRLEG